MIRTTFKYILAFGLLTGAASCTKDFENVNTNPNTLPDLPPDALFTKVALDVSGGEYEAWRGNFIYTTLFVQQFASTAWGPGDKYFLNEGYSSALWDSYYGSTIKNVVNLVEKTRGVENQANYYNASRILKAFAFQRLTDLYGDLPYKQAGKGFFEGVYSPVYDPQSEIYDDLLKELEEAAAGLDAAQPFKGDIIYSGNVALWKKAAYSLMLRVAMRLSKADQTKASQWAAKAVAGGVFSSYEESFSMKHLEGQYDNPNSHVLGYYNGARVELKNNNFKFSTTFLNLLDELNDPRFKILSVVRQGDADNDDAALQKGLPNGLDLNQLPDGIGTYSQLRATFVDATDPNIFVSHGQTLLLMAEAAVRGWITGDEEQLFRDGIKSSIHQLKLYSPGAGLFDNAAIDAYAAAVPFGANDAEKIVAINKQYYIVSLLDGYESFANWRRTGVPSLTAVNYPGNYTGGTIPRRLQYPASEFGLNGPNLEAAIARQGVNDFTTRVWWDKQ